MIHFGCLGYSPRTTSEAQRGARSAPTFAARRDRRRAAQPARSSVEIGYRPGEPKRVTVDGAAERSIERLLGRFPVLVFTPDRLRRGAGRAGAAPRLPRPRAGAPVAGAWRPRPPSMRAGWRSATTCCGGCAPAPPQAGALDPWDSAAGRGRGALIAARARLLLAAGGAVRRAGWRRWAATPGERPLRYRPNVEPGRPLAAAAGGAPRPRHRAGRHRRRPAPGRRRAVRARPRPAPVRLAGRAAPRAAGADPGRGRSAGRGARRAAAAAARRRHRRARRRAPAAAAARRWQASTRRSSPPPTRPTWPARLRSRAAGRGGQGGGVSDLRPIARRRAAAGTGAGGRLRMVRGGPRGCGARRWARRWPPTRCRCAAAGECAGRALRQRRLGQRADAARAADAARGWRGCSTPPPPPLRFEVGDVDGAGSARRPPRRASPRRRPATAASTGAASCAAGISRPGICGEAVGAGDRGRPGARFVTPS